MKLDADTAEMVAILRAPERTVGWRDTDWSRLVGAARGANLLGALAERLHCAGIQPAAAARRHLDGARQLSERQRLSVVWEAHGLRSVLAGLDVPVVLLKGAAYVLAYPEFARGRLFGDIDVLLPRSVLAEVESQLMLNGWASAKPDAYDQRYYREWMHELPPMVNVRRGTVLDVHHTILPLTARNTPDPAAIIGRSLPVEGLAGLRVPCPEDLVVHSITHLMYEGELHNGLRDLHDIDAMLRSFSVRPDFWSRLAATAADNDLAAPVANGLRLAARVFDSPVPAQVLARLDDGSHRRTYRLLEPLYMLALQSPQTTRPRLPVRLARLAIYLRGHWLRMPLPQLLRHLAVKAWKGARAAPGATPPELNAPP